MLLEFWWEPPALAGGAGLQPSGRGAAYDLGFSPGNFRFCPPRRPSRVRMVLKCADSLLQSSSQASSPPPLPSLNPPNLPRPPRRLNKTPSSKKTPTLNPNCKNPSLALETTGPPSSAI